MNLNKFHLICLCISFALLHKTSWAQQNQFDVFSTSKEVYFQFTIQNKSELNQLTHLVSIDKVDGLTIFAYANQKQFASFVKTGISYTILQAPSTLQAIDMFDIKTKSNFTWDSYPTYESFEMMMDTLAKQHSSICKLDTITTLTSGHRILALKITDHPDSLENEPKFLYVGSIHGDETVGYLLLLRLADSLIQQYGINTELTNLINSVELWIVPLANPDGTFAGGNNTVYGATRFNTNGIDINRNFPDRILGNDPYKEGRQQETAAFMRFDSIHNFNMSATLHGGSVVVNYPWDVTATLHADNNWWATISKKYADTILTYAPNTYFYPYSSGYTNGYAWYDIYGGRQDYLNYVKHCREITIEMSTTKTPTGHYLLTLWDYQHRSLLNLIKESTKGITGQVHDSLTLKPIYASVFINNHDKDSSNVYSSINTGAFFRPIAAGNYSISISASGYNTKTINNLLVNQDSTIKLDILLSKTSNEITTISANSSSIKLIRINENSYQIYNPNNEIITLNLFTMDGKLMLSKQINTTEQLNTSHFHSSMYFVQLTTSNSFDTYKLYKR